MNLRFLGDVLDHWKGSIISRLSDAQLLHNLMVDQMATDFSQWREIDHTIYAKLLMIERESIVPHGQELSGNRKAYVQEILKYNGDLFLDPDTGICTNSQAGSEHLKATELHAILDCAPERIVMVYQHNGRTGNMRARVVEVMFYLQRHGAGFHAYAYESATTAMLFLCRKPERVDLIGAYFKQMLDWHGDRRISHWQSPAPGPQLMIHRKK